MKLNDLIKALKNMLPEKIPCCALIDPNGTHADTGPEVYPKPEAYLIEQAIAEIKKLSEIQDILGPIYDTDHIRELIQADREGRYPGQSFRVGDTAWQTNGTDVFPLGIKSLIYDCGYIAFGEPAVGFTVFKTQEEAWDALAKMKEAAHE